MTIYFIRAGDEGPVKIGSAEDVGHRMAELQAGNPAPLILLREIPGGRRTEHFVHRQFKHLHIRGEWFHFDMAMLMFDPDFVEMPRPRNTLNEYLRAAKVSKEAFAKTVGVTPEAVRLWCLGVRTPRWKAIQAIRKATDGKVDVWDFEPAEIAAQ